MGLRGASPNDLDIKQMQNTDPAASVIGKADCCWHLHGPREGPCSTADSREDGVMKLSSLSLEHLLQLTLHPPHHHLEKLLC